MLLSKGVLGRAVSLVLIMGPSACLRAQDQPEEWPCASDDDCESGQTCYRSGESGKKACRSAGHCEMDAECSVLEACIAHSCTAVECKQDEEGACAPFVCSDNACLTSCQGSDDCIAGSVCDQGDCVLTECTISSGQDCEGFACVEGLCLDTCSGSNDCAAGYWCSDGRCVPDPVANGSSCEADLGCLSGHCCPTDAVGAYQCATGCSLRALGEACAWGAICSSGRCDDGVCAPCIEGECRERVCGERECGTIRGVNCGTCEDTEFCSPGGQCTLACVDMGCGIDHGVACGPCANETYCSESFACLPWTDCSPGTEVWDAPSPTADRTCSECVGGYSTKANAQCQSWTDCGGIEDIPPSTTTDRVCHEGWNRTYGKTTRAEESFALELVPGGGGAFVGGYTAPKDGSSPSTEFAYVRRIDSAQGDIVWERLFGASSVNQVLCLDADSSGNVYAAGNAFSDVGGGAHLGLGDVYVRKLAAADGAPAWTKSVGTTSMEAATSVSIAPDGSVLVAGYTQGALAGAKSLPGATDTFAFKLAGTDGSVLWQTQFGPGGGAGIAANSTGDVFVASSANVPVVEPEGVGRFTVRKLSGATGAELWTRRLGHHDSDSAQLVAVDGEDIFVAGFYDGGPAVMKMDGVDGTRLWVEAVESATLEAQILSLAVTPQGTVLLSGFTNADLDEEGVVGGGYALELDGDDGSTLWIEQFGVWNREYPFGIASDGAGDIWLTGTRRHDGDDAPDMTHYNSFVAKLIRE